MNELLQPKYIMAAFTVLMLIWAFYLGYKAGKRRGRKEVIDALNIPPGHVINAISFRRAE